jgi:hypothetical protein
MEGAMSLVVEALLFQTPYGEVRESEVSPILIEKMKACPQRKFRYSGSVAIDDLYDKRFNGYDDAVEAHKRAEVEAQEYAKNKWLKAG